MVKMLKKKKGKDFKSCHRSNLSCAEEQLTSRHILLELLNLKDNGLPII